MWGSIVDDTTSSSFSYLFLSISNLLNSSPPINFWPILVSTTILVNIYEVVSVFSHEHHAIKIYGELRCSAIASLSGRFNPGKSYITEGMGGFFSDSEPIWRRQGKNKNFYPP
jgi:hypothetical protein